MRRLPLLLAMLLAAGCTRLTPGSIDEIRTLDVGTVERAYRLVVPADVREPIPLVLVFHGFASTPARIRASSSFDALAGAEGFAVAFPQGAGLVPAWRTDAETSAPDVAFARAIVDDVAATVDIDPTRVYAAGMSNGGGMAGRLACDASDVFAAVGVVAAAHRSSECSPGRPVPVIAFHGDADPIVPLSGVPGIAEDVVGWLEARAVDNRCDVVPAEERVADDVVELAWSGCEADVVLYLVEGGGHVWPGPARSERLDEDPSELSATVAIWEFFSEHPLP
jgi:polyhydroxybutyrate depolymerase